MLDQLMNLVRQHAGSAVIDNPAIPNEKNEQAVKGAGTSIISTLQHALSGGKINDVLGYFKNGGKASPEIVREATDNYANDLQQNVGLDAAQARDVAGRVVPQTMDSMAAKAADPSDNSFNIQDIFNQLSGGKTGGMNIQSMLNKFGDKDGDGDVDLQDLKSMFGGRAAGGGGLMDRVKGMF